MWQIAGSRLATSLLERVRAGVAHFEQLPLFRRGSNLPPRWMGGTLARLARGQQSRSTSTFVDIQIVLLDTVLMTNVLAILVKKQIF